MAAYGAMLTYRVLFAVCLLTYGIVFAVAGEISDLRRCADRECKVTLSRAQALARHPAGSPLFLDFNRGDIIEVKSKSAGSRQDLWSGEVNGRRGYFPKTYVREFEVLEKDPMLDVPTEESEFAKKAPSREPPPAPVQEPPPTPSKPEIPTEVEKDETEIDETDLTEDDSVDSPETPKENAASEDKVVTGQAEKDESDAENGDPALFKDPLLQEIEALQKSFMKLTEAEQDPTAFNEFLASKFGAESTEFTSTAGKESAQPAAQQSRDIPDAPANEPGLDDDEDETDLDIEDNEFFFPTDMDEEKAGTSQQEDVKEQAEETKQQEGEREADSKDQEDVRKEEDAKDQENVVQEEQRDNGNAKGEEVEEKTEKEEDKKEEEASPYINGVRVLEVDDEEEEEEEEEKTIEEQAETEEKKQEQEGKPPHDEPEENEVEEVELKLDDTEVDETEVPNAEALGTSAPSTSAAQDSEDDTELPDAPAAHYQEHTTEEGTVDKEQTEQGQDETASKDAESQPKMTPEVPLVDTPLVPSSEDSVSTGTKPETDTAEPKIGGDGQQKAVEGETEEDVEKILNFQSEWLGDSEESAKTDKDTEDVDKMKVEGEEFPKVAETLGKIDIQEGEEKSDSVGDDGGVEVEVEGEEPMKVEPDKTVQEPPPSSTHQPVDIDFIQPSGTQAQDSSIQLETSETEPQQPGMPTPALQSTPSLEHAAQSEMSEPNAAFETKPTETEKPVKTAETPTTVIDGTTFYLEDGEIADIVPESVAEPKKPTPHPEDAPASPPPTQATVLDNIQPSVVPPVVPEVSAQQVKPETAHHQDAKVPQEQLGEIVNQPGVEVPDEGTVTGDVESDLQVTSQMQNASEKSPADQILNQGVPSPNDALQHDTGEHYQTSADFVTRKVLSVSQATSQVPTPPKATDSAQQVPPVQPPPPKVTDQIRPSPGIQESSLATDTLSEPVPTPNIQPSASVESTTSSASVTIEGEEENLQNKQDQQHIPERKFEQSGSDEGIVVPPLAFEVPPAESMMRGGGGAPGKGKEAEQGQNTVTPPPPPPGQEWDGIPPPPSSDDVTPPADEWTPSMETQDQVVDEPTLEEDPYQMDDYWSRKITDEDLAKAEEEAAAYESKQGTLMGSLEAQTKAFINKLPPSVQSLLEQEPLGLSPAMTVLVTMTAFAMFLSIACASCFCSGGKKSGKKDPLVVVRELEEKLLMAVKEKENLEDLLQEKQSENKRLKDDMSGLQNSSSDYKTDLQNVTLHNEALKAQVETLQTEIVELQEQLSKKSEDVKFRDKKTKDFEKEAKKLNEAKSKLEKDLQKKETECQRLEDENESMKSTIQSLTDQVQLLDTSKQQLLSEAEDWKEKVEEMKERLEQLEQECKQAQETISFKDNELEVMKDCYLQLKAFEKEKGEGDSEDFDAADSKDVQEKIQAMMDVSKVNATLRAVQEEKDMLENKLKIENDARKELEEQLECVRRESESSMADRMKAERQAQEAQTKLAVLSSYFKEKELQLQRELGEHEALKKQNLSKLDSADETYRSMSKELEMCKQQVDSLKRELAASERDFRSQIAANEKKAHENWLNARAAERELKEARHEAAVLRQKLTDVERRQMGPGGIIRPLPTRGMPPPGMLNGPPPPPPPGMERSPSRGSLPPGVLPPGPPPPFRDDDFPISPRERERLPPSHPARHMPDARSPPPRMPPPPPDSRGSPPRLPPPDARSPPPRIPPPYDRRGPPPPMDSRSPPMRLPPPDMLPPMRGPLPPHMGPPPMGSPVPRDSPRDGYSPRDGRLGPSPRDQYGRQPPSSGERRHQSQV